MVDIQVDILVDILTKCVLDILMDIQDLSLIHISEPTRPY